MLNHILSNIPVILGSQSPRRKELLASIDVNFDVVVRNVDESIPSSIASSDAAEYVAVKKLDAFKDATFLNKLIITADTVVVDAQDNVLGKPSSVEEAKSVLLSLSGKLHIVHTGVALAYRDKQIRFTDSTEVYFEVLSEEEINYYIEKYKPCDKAGSYGIQEWIGRVAISKIVGSYENVMGLPTVKVYQAIKEIIK